jgi:hypothetical protein
VIKEEIPGIKTSSRCSVWKRWRREIYSSTANLAVFYEMGFKVRILDADIYRPSMPIMFDV